MLALSGFRRLPLRVRRFVVRRATPSFWVGTMCVVERVDGALLLVRQSYRRGWCFPGGLLKRNEQPAVAVRREVEEEVGVEVEVHGDPAVVIEARSRRVDMVYRARSPLPADAVPSPQSAEILEVRWFPPDELPNLQPEAATALAALRRKSPGGVTEAG